MSQEKKCSGLHCKCMNLDKLCPHMHYADCKEHNPSLFSPIVEEKEGWEKYFDIIYYGTIEQLSDNELWKYCRGTQVKDLFRRLLSQTLAEEKERLVKEIEGIEPAPELDEYLDKVKNGNRDDMYDYGVKITRKMCINIIKNNK